MKEKILDIITECKLGEITTDEATRQVLDLFAVSGSLSPVDNRVIFADYIQRCVIEKGQMTYPSLQAAIKVWDETTERFGGNDR